jgi:hypothetical protein
VARSEIHVRINAANNFLLDCYNCSAVQTADQVHALEHIARQAPQTTTTAICVAQSDSERQDRSSTRPLRSFLAHAGFSVQDIIAHSPGSWAQHAPYTFDDFPSRLARYKARISSQLGVAVPDICWFVQHAFEVAPGVPLSMSTTFSSNECVVSLGTNFYASVLQCALLTAQLRSDAGVRS